MVSAELIALLERLAEPAPKQDDDALSPAERALLAAHARELRAEDKRQSSTLDHDQHTRSKETPASRTPAINAALIDELERAHAALAQQSAVDLTVTLPRFIEALEAADMSKADTLALADRLLPSGGPRPRSRTQALGAIKGRLMQRFRDAVRTAKLGDRG